MSSTSKIFTYVIRSSILRILTEHYKGGYMTCRAQYSVKMWGPLFKSKRKMFTFFCSFCLHQSWYFFTYCLVLHS